MGRDALEWTVHPLRAHPWKGVFVLAVVLLVEYTLVFVWYSPFMALLSAFLLVAATGRFLFPSHFRLDASGAEVRFLGTTQRRRWSELRRMREARSGVLLTPFRRPSRLDEARGLFLVFGEGDSAREEVLTYVRTRLAQGARGPTPASASGADAVATGAAAPADGGKPHRANAASAPARNTADG
ncbi:MAG: hypothetical protein D6729_05700 [Deltaproteobacteria bacterium]|nr:MAG: hypothetical protein D6729_05700 [Deltaproteobacteria bacterium]